MFQWLAYVSSISLLFPLAAAVYGYRRLDNILRLLAWLLIIGGLIEISNIIFSQLGKNNIWLINIYMLVEAFVFCYLLGKWSETKRMFIVSIALFSFYFLFSIYDTFLTGSMYKFSGEDKIMKGIILIFLSCYFLIRLSTNENIILMSDYRFWIASAILVYSAVTLIVFGTSNFVLSGNKYASYYCWVIHSITDIISNFMIATGFVWYYRKRNLSS
jgi:hypothetical protein